MPKKNTEYDFEEITYICSHDLKEPLRSISSFAQLLADHNQDKLDNTSQEYIDYIMKGVARMHYIIHDLAAYSVAGSDLLNVEEFDMNQIVEEACLSNSSQINEAKAQINYDSLPRIKCDFSKISHLFQNLIANAIKFRGDQTPKIEILFEDRPRTWLFAVKDNGIGIEKKYHKAIFKPLKRLHRNSDIPGTGIGLAICKKIVEKHKGTISVRSGLDGGCEFRFTISKNL